MSYTVLARKYRPQAFSEMVGQEHVAKTLANAIASGRVAHAFLFTGVRGVGKTTTARLLAKALCCEKGPTPEPCNECAACRDITTGVDMDVQEIDGASNNSVDDVRRLQESLPYRPSRNRFKIVIVDEVHMLSQGAFNAFLKTLEEPPPHVKFMFATTEAHKVPVTIRSRCQRYDFRLIPQSVVAKRVRQILEAESVEADEGALAIVAREAAGSMRDALTLLDQLVAFAGTSLRGEEVARTLGIADRKQVHDAARAILEGDGAAALGAVDGLAKQGADMLHCTKQLLELIRDLVVLRVAGEDSELVDLVEEERQAARELAGSIEPLELQRAFSALSKLTDEVARSAAPRTVLEMGLVRIATRPPLRPLGELIARLDELERRIGPAGPPGGGGGGGGRPRRHGRSAGSAAEVMRSLDPSGSATPAGTSPTGQSARPPAPSPSTHPQDPPRATTPPGPAPAQVAAEGIRPVATTASAPAASVEPAQGPDAAGLAAWQRIVEVMHDRAPAFAAIVRHGAALTVTRERLVIGFDEGSFYVRQAQDRDVLEAIANAASSVLGGRPEVEVREATGSISTGQSVAQLEAADRDARRRKMEEQAWSHPRVRDAMEIFPEARSSAKVHVEID